MAFGTSFKRKDPKITLEKLIQFAKFIVDKTFIFPQIKTIITVSSFLIKNKKKIPTLGRYLVKG